MTLRRLTVKHSLLLLAIAAGALALAASGLLTGLFDPLGYLLPPLLLLLTLLWRRYPGERALLGLIQDARSRGRRRPAAAAPARPRLRTMLPRGGRLFAFSLAVRPPPAFLLTRC